MNHKIIGIVLIVVGIALAFWGYDIYDAPSSQLTRAINGETPIEAWAAMVGGAILALIGMIRLK